MVVPPAVRLGLVSRTLDRDTVMQALTVPVLVTQGEKDGVVLASHMAHLLSCIPQSQVSVYAGVGHAPPLEAPERFNGAGALQSGTRGVCTAARGLRRLGSRGDAPAMTFSDVSPWLPVIPSSGRPSLVPASSTGI